MRRGVSVFLAVAALLVLLPAMARAQDGQIAGSVRDASDALIPGVTVEVASPALIEKIRTATTDSNGQYRLTNLPVGTYKVTFSLAGFTKQERDGILVTTDNTVAGERRDDSRAAHGNRRRLRLLAGGRRAERARSDQPPG